MTAAKREAEVGGGLWHWLMQDTMDGLRRRRAILGYLFLLPTLLGIFIFTAGPVFVSFGLSLFRWNIFRPPDYIELANYERLISDARIAISFGNTLKFTVLAVATQVSIGLILALAVHRITSTAMRYYFRTAFFLPLLMSGVMVMYEQAFKAIECGYVYAIAVVLFLVIMAFTAAQMWMSRRWVFYQ